MKKIWTWFKTSNRYKHLIGGVLVGFAPLNWWAGIYAAVVCSLAMEYKDKAHGGNFDWIDAAMTILGGGIGALLTLLV